MTIAVCCNLNSDRLHLRRDPLEWRIFEPLMCSSERTVRGIADHWRQVSVIPAWNIAQRVSKKMNKTISDPQTVCHEMRTLSVPPAIIFRFSHKICRSFLSMCSELFSRGEISTFSFDWLR
jgi:hypothetical protein